MFYINVHDIPLFFIKFKLNDSVLSVEIKKFSNKPKIFTRTEEQILK